MDDDYIQSVMRHNIQLIKDLNLRSKFGSREANLLKRCFYDERLKIVRHEVPIFAIYSVVCDAQPQKLWGLEMNRADMALLNLTMIKYIQKVKSSEDLAHYVGPAGNAYELTATGLEILQSWHPSVALQVRAWIKVMPPWLVLVGSIAAAIGAIWKITDLLIDFWSKLH